jgi:hypothetical protein
VRSGKSAASFNHFVGAGEKSLRNRKAKRFGRRARQHQEDAARRDLDLLDEIYDGVGVGFSSEVIVFPVVGMRVI